MISKILLFILIAGLFAVIAIPLVFLGILRRGTMRMRQQAYRPLRKDEGDVSVSGRDAASEEKLIDDNVGQYVDYEEVEDNK